MNPVPNNSSNSERYTTYADTSRIYAMCILSVFFLCMIAMSVWAFTEVDTFGKRAFWVAIAVAAVYSSTKFVLLSFQAYFVKATFGNYGAECSLLGKPLKKLNWDEIEDIVCVRARRVGPYGGCTDTYYLMFSGHILTDEEKSKSIKLAGLKNDIIVIKCTNKNVSRIRRLHNFSYVDESGTKNST